MDYNSGMRRYPGNCRKDGLHWTAKNSNLLLGQDGEMLKIADDLWPMYYGPDGYFNQAGCDIRIALFKGQLK